MKMQVIGFDNGELKHEVHEEPVATDFTVGRKVAAKAFTDCFGKHHARIDDMTIQRVWETEPAGALSKPHVRLVATAEHGDTRYLEAATRFFELI